jgi:hypothetical protein
MLSSENKVQEKQSPLIGSYHGIKVPIPPPPKLNFSYVLGPMLSLNTEEICKIKNQT